MSSASHPAEVATEPVTERATERVTEPLPQAATGPVTDRTFGPAATLAGEPAVDAPDDPRAPDIPEAAPVAQAAGTAAAQAEADAAAEAVGPVAGPDPEQPTDPGEARDTRGTFRSLRVRNYRLFATGQFLSNTGTWMMRIAQDWLVLSLTGSAAAVGITSALQFLPMLLFGLYGGVIADRYAKRKLLMITQSVMGILGIVLFALTLSGVVRVWQVYLLALLLGLATVVDNPARQAFVVEMVGPRDVRNAVSLNAANFQTARIVGPAVAGVLIAAVGSAWAFAINGLSFVAPLTALLLMRESEMHRVPRAPREKGQLREGLRHVAGRPDLLWPIVLVGFVGTFGYNFPIWLTAFVDGVYRQGAGTYGLLNTLMAVGALVGALLAARRRTTRMRVLIGCALAFGTLEVAAALAPAFWLFVVLLVLIGLFGLSFHTTANTSVQLATDPLMRGRVMSLYMMVFMGGTPIGAPLVGWVTDTYGARVGLVTGGLVSVVAAIVVGLVLVRIGNLRVRVDLHPGEGRRLIELVPKDKLAAAA